MHGHKSKNMQNMIIKGWDKCGIDKAFIHEFKLKAMVANVKSSLFKVTPNVEENIEDDNISDPTIPLNNIIRECLIVDVDETSSTVMLVQDFHQVGCSQASNPDDKFVVITLFQSAIIAIKM